jgi:Na+/H+ antiporter NhaC
MLTYAILAIVIITIFAFMFLGFKCDEAKQYWDESDTLKRSVYTAINRAKLEQEGKLVGPDQYEPDFAPALYAIVLILLCAACGLTFCTIFFTLCFAAIAFQTADLIKAKVVVDQFAAGRYESEPGVAAA